MQSQAKPQIPRSVKLREETKWLVVERYVRSFEKVTFKALRVGGAYIVGYVDEEGVKNYALVAPLHVVRSGRADFVHELVRALRVGQGERVELAEVEAASYIVEERRTRKYVYSPWPDIRVYQLVEWESGPYLYLLRLEVGETLAVEGP